ncbi:double-stranded RNA-binding protein 4 isoform X2 [Eutrema salsugineum]|uniref:double-stranded RNA-binding protein 4 isoform X2 n=1 Tax=Eutrema salsugineum TaxID=72664 RepID=UPI000CED2C48|nr:double-stranded RNA-binding protein 4 isoform X2 [Eutrema salsugineum]
MFHKVVSATRTPSQSLSPPGDASPSSLIAIPPPHLYRSTTHAPPQDPSSPAATRTGVVEKLMHKNDLNTYCQRLSIPLPVYQTAFGGCGHAPTFTSSVSVGNKIFTSPNTFPNRKSAEQDAAKLALQHLLNEDEVSATNLRGILRKDKTRCKMILNEFLAKIKMECTYETVQAEKDPVFVSYLALNGTCYRGEGGKNKKDAEQLAALAAILSLLNDPTYATPISEVIKSKFNACAVLNELKDVSDTRDCSVTDKGVAGHPTGAVTMSRCSDVNLPRTSPIFSKPQHEIKLPEAAQGASEQIAVPLQFVPPPAHNPANNLVSSKKRRRKNKKNGNKRLRADNKPGGCSDIRSEC